MMSKTVTATRSSFGLDDLDGMHHLIDGSLSPDGTRVALSVSRRDGDAERRVAYIVETATSELMATLDGGGVDELPTWSPDGTRLAFVSDRDGERAQLHLVDADGSDVRQLTTEERGTIGAPLWSPDGTRIAVGTYVGAAADLAAPRRIERALWRLDGVGLIDDQLSQLLVIDVEAGTSRRLMGTDAMTRPLAWSPDGLRLLAAVGMRPDAAAGDVSETLWETTLEDVSRPLPVPPADSFVAAYLPDGRVAWTALGDGGAAAPETNHLWLLAADGTIRCVTEGAPFDVLGDVITDTLGDFLMMPGGLLLDGTDAIVRTQRGGALTIERIPLDGPDAPTRIAGDGRSCSYPLDLRGGRLLYARTAIEATVALAVVDLETGAETAVAAPRPTLPRPVAVPRVERLSAPCAMWFMHPTNGAAAPYPTVLLVHGGPFSSFGEAFFPTAQLLCGAGFGVLFGNPSGSRGYGDAFGQATFRDWGGVDADELLAAIEITIDRGWADRDRLGISGLSYGGYMTCLLAARTSVFAAAVAENPVVDLLSESGTADVGPTLLPVYFGADPEQAAPHQRRSSPITYAPGCRTPTLLISGADDVRCPPGQSIQFHTALRTAGCPAELLLLPEASHMGGLSGPVPGRRAQEAALLEWFERYL